MNFDKIILFYALALALESVTNPRSGHHNVQSNRILLTKIKTKILINSHVLNKGKNKNKQPSLILVGIKDGVFGQINIQIN